MASLPAFVRDRLGTHGDITSRVQSMPLFITGTMRSGSTLLVNKLAQHPQLLKVGSEMNEIWTAIGGASCLETCNYRNESHADYRYAFQMTSYFNQFIQQSKSIKRHLMRSLNSRKMQEGRVFYDWEHIIPVNKSTHLINKIKYVHTLFPESKFIFIFRDIHAQSSSLKFHFEEIYQRTGKVYRMPVNDHDCWSYAIDANKNAENQKYPGDFSSIPQMWFRLNLLAVRELAELPRDQYMFVSYADLVNKQEEVFSKLFNFLNLEARHAPKEIQIARNKSRYKNTSTSGNPLEKWKRHLTSDEKQIIEKVIQENEAAYAEIMRSFRS